MHMVPNVRVVMFAHRLDPEFCEWDCERKIEDPHISLLHGGELSRGFPVAYPNVRGCGKRERLRITDTAVLKLLLVDEGWRISRGNSARTATTRRGCSFAPIERRRYTDSCYLREYPEEASRIAKREQSLSGKKSNIVIICACISPHFVEKEREREKKSNKHRQQFGRMYTRHVWNRLQGYDASFH